jgi:hypothetical protein
MPYVHLANGSVLKVTQKELLASQAESGTPNAYRMDGNEHTVIGVYPDEVEHGLSEEQQAEKNEKDAKDKAEFAEWQNKKNQDPNAKAFDGSDL